MQEVHLLRGLTIARMGSPPVTVWNDELLASMVCRSSACACPASVSSENIHEMQVTRVTKAVVLYLKIASSARAASCMCEATGISPASNIW